MFASSRVVETWNGEAAVSDPAPAACSARLVGKACEVERIGLAE
jgi:hypothetical protein